MEWSVEVDAVDDADDHQLSRPLAGHRPRCRASSLVDAAAYFEDHQVDFKSNSGQVESNWWTKVTPRSNCIDERIVNVWNGLPPSVSFASRSTFRRTTQKVDFSQFMKCT